MCKAKKQLRYLSIQSTILTSFLWVTATITAYAQDSLRIFTFPSFANVSVTVRCNVNPLLGRYAYRYSLTSAVSSEQDVDDFLVDHKSIVDSISSPSMWLSGPFGESNTIFWGARRAEVRISPGGQLQGFNITSPGIPSIYQFYAIGYSVVPTPEWEPDSVVGNDVDNSFKGRTIAPRTPPTPFNSLTFLDTIKSYINQSRTFGWITNQATADKYTALVDSAQANLSANPSRRGITKSKLDSVLVNVNVDSSTTLTSEAYALIRFNTEYVLQKLREEDSVFAAENKSSSWDATATNNARHLAKSEGYLHEVFTSGGEIFYRRSANAGSTWDQTHRINMAVGENSHPCIVTTRSGSLQIVWQRRIAPSTYEVSHSYSQNDGETWSTPTILPDADHVGVSNYQTDGTMPVIAEISSSRTLVVVYCSDEGLRYRISENDGQNWQVPSPDIISGEYSDRVRTPSLAGGDSYTSLVYDYVDDDPYSPRSRTFDGTSWSDENSIGKGTDISDAEFSSVAFDKDQNPIATWTGTSTNLAYGKVIAFRAGYTDNTWSDWFTMFGQHFVDRLSPSVTYYDRGGEYGVAIVNHTSQNFIKLIKLTSLNPPSWDISTLSESGAWANMTQETSSSGTPVYCWTDQGTSPYEVVVGSSGLASIKGRVVGMTTDQGVSQKRRAIVHHRRLRATLALEFEPLKIILASGDTSVIPFKASALRQRGKINFSNMWDYLGSDVMSVPPNARRLVVSKQFGLRGVPIGVRKFSLHVLNTSGISIAVLDTTSGSGTVSVNIAPYAGMNVTFRPSLVLGGIEPSSVDIGVGDVFIAPTTGSTPMREGKSR